MTWFNFLGYCSDEEALISILFDYLLFVPDTRRRYRPVEEAFIEFKYMWE